MKRILNFLCAAVVLALSSCSGQQPGVVEVEGGKIHGIVTDSMSVYKGIPFAAPPVGELRWKAPQPVVPWDGVLETTEFAASPVQGGNGNCSEDCLYLNVWTPAKSPKEKLPVMVWIYGGGFAGGSTSFFDGAPLAGKGVVFVSVAYRVGRLGFFSHPELSAENPEHVSGNYGLLDQIAGLKWVQNNIAKFGGDPSKVTIFGESAGGISVSMLCASPLAKGLFRGAISQSGGSFGPSRRHTYPGENMKLLKDAEQDGVKAAEELGCKSLAELRALDASKFAGGMMGASNGWPIVDGYVIPDNQVTMYENGNYNDVAVLVGYNSDEGASFSGRNTAEQQTKMVEERFGPYADSLLAAYPMGEGKLLKSGRDLMRDAAFGWHTWKWACLQSEKKSAPVFLYYFDQHPDYPEDSPLYGLGSPHGQDVDFVFGSLKEQRVDSDAALSEVMMDYWTNFAKNLDPNGPGVPEWDAFTPENHKAIHLTGAEPTMGLVPDEGGALNVLDRYFEWRRTSEGAQWANSHPEE